MTGLIISKCRVSHQRVPNCTPIENPPSPVLFLRWEFPLKREGHDTRRSEYKKFELPQSGSCLDGGELFALSISFPDLFGCECRCFHTGGSVAPTKQVQQTFTPQRVRLFELPVRLASHGVERGRHTWPTALRRGRKSVSWDRIHRPRSQL